jgi:hypothetical protein
MLLYDGMIAGQSTARPLSDQYAQHAVMITQHCTTALITRLVRHRSARDVVWSTGRRDSSLQPASTCSVHCITMAECHNTCWESGSLNHKAHAGLTAGRSPERRCRLGRAGSRALRTLRNTSRVADVFGAAPIAVPASTIFIAALLSPMAVKAVRYTTSGAGDAAVILQLTIQS